MYLRWYAHIDTRIALTMVGFAIDFDIIFQQ